VYVVRGSRPGTPNYKWWRSLDSAPALPRLFPPTTPQWSATSVGFLRDASTGFSVLLAFSFPRCFLPRTGLIEALVPATIERTLVLRRPPPLLLPL